MDTIRRRLPDAVQESRRSTARSLLDRLVAGLVQVVAFLKFYCVESSLTRSTIQLPYVVYVDDRAAAESGWKDVEELFVDVDAMVVLEERKIINWCRTTRKLYPLKNDEGIRNSQCSRCRPI